MSSDSTSDAQPVQRVCFIMQLKRDRVDDYLKVHAHVWPEMLKALSESGYRNFSLFVRRDDGLVVAYLETDDYDQAAAAMALREVNTRWQEGMAQYFEQGRPDKQSDLLEHYFHLA
jgi:L-rhamnose mutarotase